MRQFRVVGSVVCMEKRNYPIRTNTDKDNTPTPLNLTASLNIGSSKVAYYGNNIYINVSLKAFIKSVITSIIVLYNCLVSSGKKTVVKTLAIITNYHIQNCHTCFVSRLLRILCSALSKSNEFV